MLEQQLITDVAKRLIDLAENLEDDEEGIDLASVDYFWEFIAIVEPRLPCITITDSGNVKATWHNDEAGDQLFWIEFKPDKTLKYLAFTDDSKYVGNSTLDRIMDWARHIGVAEWITRK